MTPKKLALMMAMLLFLPSLASATLTKYSTSGTVSGASFITYKGVNNATVFPPAPPAFTTGAFGMLKIKCSSTCNSAVGASLTVMISQSMPGSGTGTVTTAALVGTFTSSGGSIGIDWSGPVNIVTHVSGKTYVTTYNPVDLFKVCSSGTCNVKLKVDISQAVFVPEPHADLMLSLGMLGLMGLVSLSRKRIVV